MSEPVFLSFETATRHGSVAIMRGDKALSAWRGDGATASHSLQLLPAVAECRREAGVALTDLAFVGVAVGPGSFTGLRVGLATAQGLADTLQLPLVGVATLEALALAAGRAARTVALLPAGRNEVFAQSFAVDRNNAARPLDELVHAPPAHLWEAMLSFTPLTWAGDGDDFLHADALRRFAAEHGRDWCVASNEAPLAVSVGRLALRAYRAGQVSDRLLHALYVRGADIKLKQP